MSDNKEHWFENWFNQDYTKLYTTHDQKEADDHVDFIITSLGLTGSERILDLGCGMGRHTLAFGRKGFNVVGVDLSSYLIQQAQDALARESHLNVTFLENDMFQLSNLGSFDCVVNLFTSFGYFDSDKKNSSILKVVKEHLKTDGKFFLDYLHPHQVIENLIPHEEKDVDGELVVVEKRIENDRVIKSIIFPDRMYTEKVKLYTREQIERMFHEHGFQIVSVYNDYQGNPWIAEGDRQLFLASTNSHVVQPLHLLEIPKATYVN